MKEAVPFDERLVIISECSLFRVLNANTRSEIARSAISRKYHAGKALFYRGESADSLLLVVDGLLRLSLLSAYGQEFSLCIAARGDAVGENAFVGSEQREADCLAITTVRVLKIYRSALPESAIAKISYGLNTLFSQRLRELLTLMEDVTLHNLETRLARLLCRLELQQHFSLLQLHQSLLANMVGATRPKVNQQLQRFHHSGAIELLAGKIVSVDRKLLEGLAGGIY